MRHPDSEEVEIVGFDTKVTHRDKKTGQVIKRTPYIKRVVKAGESGSARYFERPVGSGNLWDKGGDPVGRWDHTRPEGERFLKNAAHVAWNPPPTEDEKLARALVQKDHENEALKAELAALKAEQAKKQKPRES